MEINLTLAIDSYKLGHITMYPDTVKETYHTQTIHYY